MHMKIDLGNGTTVYGELEKIEYRRKNNGLYDVNVNNFIIENDDGTKTNCRLVMENTHLDTNEESGIIQTALLAEIKSNDNGSYRLSVYNNGFISNKK